MVLLDELELEKDEDAQMSMAAHPQVRYATQLKANHPDLVCHFQRKELACGINSATEKLEKGENENCRVYGVHENKWAVPKSHRTQRVT